MQPSTDETYRQRILRVLVYIQTHLDDALDLETLARVAHFSPYHFHRIFRGMVGEAVKQHVRRLRIERAAYRLKFTEQSVTRIAFDAGYETHESFTRRFGDTFRQSPSQFRKAHRAMEYPPTESGVHYAADGELTEFTTAPGDETMEVRIETLDPMRVVFVRHTGPYDQVGGTWMKLMTWAGTQGLMGSDAVILGICYDDPDVTPPDKIRYDACIRVRQGIEPQGEFGVQDTVGGVYAVTTHRGPYDKLSETYLRLCGPWLASSGYEARSAPCLEFYQNSPMDTASENLLTDVHLPVEK